MGVPAPSLHRESIDSLIMVYLFSHTHFSMPTVISISGYVQFYGSASGYVENIYSKVSVS